MTKHVSEFWGDALSKRPTLKSDKFTRKGGMATSLDGVTVDIRSTVSGSTYTSNSLAGTEFERMRRYGLMLAKWSYPDTAKNAKRSGVPESALQATNRVVANAMYKGAFGEDPTTNTMSVKPYIGALVAGNVSEDLWSAISALIGTDAMAEILTAIKSKNPDAFDELANLQVDVLDFMSNAGTYADYLHQSGRRASQYAEYFYGNIARKIVTSHRTYEGKRGDREARRKTKKGKPSGKSPEPGTRGEETNRDNEKVVRRLEHYTDPNWFTPYLAKYPLEIPHTGKKGRRLIPASEGRSPKAFYRMVTDPYRRIFQRKTRSLGGVVVFDCSGSMGLSDEDIKAVMRASSGCSIVCYSSSHDEDKDAYHGNIHLIAKGGRQARHLPHFPGGNGVDLPALKWAYYNLRLNSKSPVVWVSDGQVTGKTDNFDNSLHRETMRFVKQKHIVHVEDVDSAIWTLRRLQQGRKP